MQGRQGRSIPSTGKDFDMDRDRFDQLSRLVAAAGTRRDALRLLAVGAIAGAAGEIPAVEARKRRNARRGKQVSGEQAEFCTNVCLDCAAKPIRPGANLDRCDFDDESFVDGLNLSSAHLAKACFARAELRNARFDSAAVNRACFADADLTGASFKGANVNGAVFCGANLTGADFRGSNVKAAQLACATVGCDTILPNGKPAVACTRGERCCAGVCVDTDGDPQNCGACGNDCGLCQTCEDGECVPVPNLTVACDGSALSPEPDSDLFCTTNPNTGACQDGECNCGLAGVFDPDTGVCLCDADNTAFCNEDNPPRCCRVDIVCIDAEGNTEDSSACIACG
jgi:hypothetical protein